MKPSVSLQKRFDRVEIVKKIVKSKALWFIVIFSCIALLSKYFIGSPMMISGESMEMTLNNGDYVWLNRLQYRTQDPKRNDIIVLHVEKEESYQYVKRVIGMPGEKVRIKGGKVFINGEELKEIKQFDLIEDGGMARETITLGNDEYFVLGDNRNNSKDSRNVEVGIVKRNQIEGKVSFKLVPFDEIGSIE
ncbi:MAG: signal peptidase I [Lachnospiraceae bacterium]|nr:signal peptidase I [Lachnospiraceae bacterium]